jgi:hypothetical protein
MKENYTRLIDEFIKAFIMLDDLSTCYELDPIAYELTFGKPDEYGLKRWRPTLCSTDKSALKEIYKIIPVPFPPLFEQLILSYRWAEVDLRLYRLLANPPGQDFCRLIAEIMKDKALWDVLTPNGYLQFGKGPDLNYDPVCFDFNKPGMDGDYRIVQIDHEEILCKYRIKEVAELAPSFKDLVKLTILQTKGFSE